MPDGGNNSVLESAKEYFRRVDARREDVLELFSDDVEIYFPKFGVGKGKAALTELLVGLGGVMDTIVHDVDSFRYLSSGTQLTVEGTTTGRALSGDTWAAGRTPGGRFCNVFGFRDGMIVRLYVYLDPDYTSADTDRFLWGREGRTW